MKKRKEVQLEESTIDLLIKKAKDVGRSLKNYMEWVLTKHSKKD